MRDGHLRSCSAPAPRTHVPEHYVRGLGLHRVHAGTVRLRTAQRRRLEPVVLCRLVSLLLHSPRTLTESSEGALKARKALGSCGVCKGPASEVQGNPEVTVLTPNVFPGLTVRIVAKMLHTKQQYKTLHFIKLHFIK